MIFANVKALTIPDGAVTKIMCGSTLLWEAYKNWVFYSTDADGVTIYNNGKGYKDDYRVRSGGAEAYEAGVSCTGYIPYVKGDILRIWPPFNGGNTWNTVNFYDGGMSCLGQITDGGTPYGNITTAYKTKLVNGVSVLDISAINTDVANCIEYVRIGNDIGRGNAKITSGSQMIITKNEEIPL